MKNIILILVILTFLSGCAVTYQKHTGIVKCDVAIMLAKIKSEKGNAAFEIGKYLDKCYEELDKRKEK